MESQAITPSDVYNVIVSKESATIAEVARELGTRNAVAVEDAVTHLLGLQLIQPSPDSADVYRAPAPSSAFERALKAIAERLTEEAAIMTNAASHAGLQGSSDAESHFEHFDSDDAYLNRLAAILSQAQCQIDCVLPALPSPEGLASASVEDLTLLRRGVKARSIYPESARQDASAVAYAATTAEFGGEVRTSTFTPAHLIVIDSRYVVIDTPLVNDGRSSTITSRPEVVTAFGETFEYLWSQAKPLLTGSDRFISLTVKERTVLARVARGETDHAIEHATKISSSTIGRIIKSLQERTGAPNRFALGIEAERRGWLKPNQN
ncbi:MAG: hypothetical protein LBH13_02210 [Cellulomonadaceae bacterium]|jgi:DNA-binding CsgD family transcriptional regulator|nr:hypothetical protein [Cellulomonadaceae bacterium]